MNITINRESATPVYLQIANQIKGQILSGNLPAGFILPPERKLAELKKISRTTVIKAYEELKALGLVDAQTGRGTVVTEQKVPDPVPLQPAVLPMSWYPLFDKRMANLNDAVGEIMYMGNQNRVISLAAGIGDPDLYPIADFQRIQRGLPITSAHLNLSPVEGYYPLRESISQLMEGRNLTVTAKETMILSGSMQGIDFAARAFLSPGDAVIVEEPTFLQAIKCFRATVAKIIGIPMDQEGMRLDVLEAQISRYKPKFIYTIPNFHNPTGITMSMARRKALLKLAYRFQVPILEDDPYGDITFDQEHPLPIKALDTYGYVIYLSTLSKALFPGLRIGWTVAPEAVMKKFLLLKQITDLHVNTDSQILVDRYLRDGCYGEHLKKILPLYRKKRDAAAKVLRQEHSSILFDFPAGGFYFWCRLPYAVPQKKLLALCGEQGMIYTPGNVFYPQESDGEHWARLNFTYERMDRLKQGLMVFIKSVKKLNEWNGTRDTPTGARPIV